MRRDKFRYCQNSSNSVETSIDIVKTVQNVLRQAHILLRQLRQCQDKLIQCDDSSDSVETGSDIANTVKTVSSQAQTLSKQFRMCRDKLGHGQCRLF